MICAPLLLAAHASGQNVKAGLTVSPGVVYAKVSKEVPTAQTVVTIRNNYDTAVSLAAELRDIDQTSTQLLPGGVLSPELSKSLSLSETQIVIASRTDYKLRIQTSHTDQLAPGGHYAALLLTQIGGAGANLSVQSAVSVMVFLTNTDGVKESLALDDFSAPSSVFKVADSVNVTLKNDGNVHTVPRGFVRVEKRDGTVLAEGVLNVGSNVTLPGNSYTTNLKLTKVTSTWLPERVTTQLQFRPDGSSQATVAVSTEWFVPPRFVALALLFITAVGFFVWLLLPRIVKAIKIRRTKTAKLPEDLAIPTLETPAPAELKATPPAAKDSGEKITVRVGRPAKKIIISKDE